MLEVEEDFEVVGEVVIGCEVVVFVICECLDVVLMDIWMFDGDGFWVIE